MQILNLIQGSDEWLEARLRYQCASEAPVVMGDSKFMGRNQLLAIKKGWEQNPAGPFKQRLFDNGHDNEDSARGLLEFDLCEDLPPVVGLTIIDGLELLSSFDGFIAPDFVWEHKDYNEVLAENVRNEMLEPHYYWQLEHQMLTAEINEVHFTVSDGTIKRRVAMIYYSIPERRTALIAGWKQFMVDLAQYETAAKTEPVTAITQPAFPAIECRVENSTVISNLGEYIPLVQRLADEQMSIVLESDRDFADKDAFNKNVKEGRSSLKTKARDIEVTFKSLAEFNGHVKQADSILQKLQSHGERQVKEAKDAKKLAITNGAQSAIQSHLAELSGTINGVQIQNVTADWNAVIKGKRSFVNMQDAVDSEIAKLKIRSNEIAATIRKNLDRLADLAGEYRFLFTDHAELILKDNSDLVNLIKMRIAEHKKAEEERLALERKRIQAEEEAKAKRAAEAKADADRKRIRNEEREELRKEREKLRQEIEAKEATKAAEEKPTPEPRRSPQKVSSIDAKAVSAPNSNASDAERLPKEPAKVELGSTNAIATEAATLLQNRNWHNLTRVEQLFCALLEREGFLSANIPSNGFVGKAKSKFHNEKKAS